MQIFNKAERIFTVKTIEDANYRLAPQTSCEVEEATAKRLIELYPTELMLIGEIKFTETEEVEEEPKEEVAKPKTIAKPKPKTKKA